MEMLTVHLCRGMRPVHLVTHWKLETGILFFGVIICVMAQHRVQNTTTQHVATVCQKSWKKLVSALGSSDADVYKHQMNHVHMF